MDPLSVTKRKNVCLFLCRSIIAQQLSTKVAAIIEARLLELLPGVHSAPDDLLKISIAKLRTIGLSETKANYVHNVARYFSELSITDRTFSGMDNESIISLLTEIKGVGRWTAEMTLMFSLGRKDVFSPDDYGIQQSMIALYGLETTNKKILREQMEKISIVWSPFRTYACLYLWKARDLNK
jgi:DNA-3-methyladenine glycosylase II